MAIFYGTDLAHVHDAGYRAHAVGSAPGILQILNAHAVPGGLVVDLGCGSGIWARTLVDYGYRVLGIDISDAMLGIARERVPEADFVMGSIYAAELPACAAVTAVGEALNYVSGPNQTNDWTGLFAKVYRALAPGGVFIFDVAGPGTLIGPATQTHFREGDDWLLLATKLEEGSSLTRSIITFFKEGELYRRSDETHYQFLFEAESLTLMLLNAGFEVSSGTVYGEFSLPPANTAFIARKPQ